MARRKKQDEDSSQENVNNNSDDTFGLPEIEYQPLEREQTRETSESTSTTTSETTSTPYEMEREEIRQNEYTTNTYYDNDDDNNSPWPKILGILAILLLIGAGVWYFGFYRPEQLAAEKADKEKREAEEARQREADLALRAQEEAERRRADSLARIAVPTTGVIDTLTERTGRYYVIIASAVDGDLILDYAKKLAPKGLSPKIIPPHGKVKFYRLAIADGDTYASTQARADELKAEYTAGTWVVKY